MHIRTTNPIEATFPTVILRTKQTHDCDSRDTTLAMVYRLLLSAERRSKRINGFRPLQPVVDDIGFKA